MSTDHSASGQALGYVYQFDRATYRLFQSGVDVVEIGVEDIDDVSVHLGDGKEIREQDKSTINSGSPLSDRSVALPGFGFNNNNRSPTTTAYAPKMTVRVWEPIV